MNMKDFLSKDLIKLDMKAETKDEALRELCNLLYEKERITDVDSFLSDVYEREREGETGIGDQIAIPHGKSDHVIKTSLTIGRTKMLDWGSLDGEPINIIILFAVRNVDNTSVHLKLLSEIATKLGNEEVIEQLNQVKTAEEMVTLFS